MALCCQHWPRLVSLALKAEGTNVGGLWMNRQLLILTVLMCSLPVGIAAFGQSTGSTTEEPAQPAAKAARPTADSGVFGTGVKVSFLGVGAEGAVRTTHRTNLRAGFNILDYSRGFNKDGIGYNAHLGFKTIEAHYDIFPKAGGFHVSPGVLVYLGDPVTANALVSGNQSFTLGGHTYFSDPANPATANGRINFNQVAAMATVGWGNLVHRDSKRFTVSFEIGAAFQGSPKSTLNFGGNVCDAPSVNCRSAASDATVRSNIVSEQGKINKSMAPFKVYPMISLGFGYKVH